MKLSSRGKVDRSLRRTPGSVTVMSGEDIKDRPDTAIFSGLLQGTQPAPTGLPLFVALTPMDRLAV